MPERSRSPSAGVIRRATALLAALWFAGRPLVNWLVNRLPVRDGQVQPSMMAIVFALIFLTGIVTQKLGIFTIFGGFLVTQRMLAMYKKKGK